MESARIIEHSTDGGKTWTKCIARKGSIAWGVGARPMTDGFGNWYRSLGSTIPVAKATP